MCKWLFRLFEPDSNAFLICLKYSVPAASIVFLKNSDKKIAKLAQNISNNFSQADKRKKLAQKRKTMREKEKQFLAGKLSAAEYAKARRNYLTLKE